MTRHLYRIIYSKAVALILVSVFLFVITSCSASKTNDSSPIGDVNYDTSVYVMSYENIEGEEDPGIVYREVVDFNKLVTDPNRTLVLYFYTTANADVYGITAGVEDLAQYYASDITFVGINTIDMRDYTTAYNIVALPEFVLIRNNLIISYFEGYNYDYWTMEDVSYWIEENLK